MENNELRGCTKTEFGAIQIFGGDFLKHKTRSRDMWKNIPWERRAEIANKIKRMPDGMRKEVLRLAFIENYSTADIEEAAKSNPLLYGRNHKPIGKRRALQIIAEEIPDYNAYQIRGKTWKRKDHFRYMAEHEKTRCANCGRTERLEWHHMIPIFLGGKGDPENLICLCKDCHEAISAYHKRIYAEHF